MHRETINNKFKYVLFDPITNKKIPCPIKELKHKLGITLTDITHILQTNAYIKGFGYFLLEDDIPILLEKLYPEEVWKAISEVNNKYEVSNYGRVRYKSKVSTNNFCLTHHIRNSDKKHFIILNYNGKQFRIYVDQLVAYHFIRKSELLEDEHIVHIDGNKSNNYYKNLKIEKISFDKQLKLIEDTHKRLTLEDDSLYPNERWQKINRPNSKYEVSDYGRVRKRFDDGRVYYIKQVEKGTSGSVSVSLSMGGVKKIYSVGRLVAEHFLEDFSSEDPVYHIDGNKYNNHYTNLKSMDRTELGRMVATKKKSYGTIECINKSTGEVIGVFNSLSSAGRALGVSRQSISDNLNGKTRLTANKYLFKRIE